ncbi:MAG: hypothetical protein P9X24_17480 [Candidatus Hatepunaea meridiana]|nr:hypothetical protein [Candidatus Hatepunaea meridiana]
MTSKTFMNTVANGEVDILQLLLDIITDTGSEYCVIGGVAVNAYAEPVVNLDLDIVVTTVDIDKISKAAQEKGLHVKEFEHSLNFNSPKSDLRIQLQTDPRYQKFIARSVVCQVLGYQMMVASAKDVLQGKVWAYLDKSRLKSKRQKDLADIMRLVEVNPMLVKQLSAEVREVVEE